MQRMIYYCDIYIVPCKCLPVNNCFSFDQFGGVTNINEQHCYTLHALVKAFCDPDRLFHELN